MRTSHITKGIVNYSKSTIMKIRINGYTIETNNIYTIGPVKGNGVWVNLNRMMGLTHSAYTFVIEFFDGKNMLVELPGWLLFGEKWHEAPYSFLDEGKLKIDAQFPMRHPEYLERLVILESKIQTFRDAIEALWADSRSSDIPTFDLKTFIKNEKEAENLD